jgi:hypothetical protein
MSERRVRPHVPAGYEPQDVPLYEDRETVEAKYTEAERAGEPFLAVERYEEGYAVTFDLLPADKELAPPAASEVGERITREVEAIVGDESLPTTEVSRTVGESLGNVSFFEREASARRVAASVSTLVLDEANWETATPPSGARGNPLND